VFSPAVTPAAIGPNTDTLCYWSEFSPAATFLVYINYVFFFARFIVFI
jgi:hypothetical protein